MSTVDSNGVYQEHDFVLVEASTGEQARIPFGEKTLQEFRLEVVKKFYPHMLKETSPNAIPQNLRLIWCGKEMQPGCSWHCGIVPDEASIKMKQLNPNCRNGQPMILAHATGGTDFIEEDEDDEDNYGQMSTMNNIKYTHSGF